jgi:hypothetical protein
VKNLNFRIYTNEFKTWNFASFRVAQNQLLNSFVYKFEEIQKAEKSNFSIKLSFGNIFSMAKAKIFYILVCVAFNLIHLQGNEMIPTNICDLELIYNDQFQFSLPKTVLEEQLSGKAFDHKEFYTDEEFDALCTDINDLFQKMLAANPIQEKIAVMTAGAPGAGKTIKMRQDLIEKQKQMGKNFAYTDPDDVCLKNMWGTYQVEIQRSDGSFQAWKGAYDKWRPGSNAANNLFLGNLIRLGYGFYFGTTSTSPHTWRFFEFLKKQGYQIRLIHVSAPDVVRWGSIQERDKSFVQTTEQDTFEKGLLFPQRISDTYLKYADQIDFYYRDSVRQDAIHAATWKRESAGLKVHQPLAYHEIKVLHNQIAEKLERPDLFWEKLVENAD